MASNKTEILKFMEEAQLIFMVNFKDNKQNISISEGVPMGDLLTSPFRLSLHLNDLLEKQLEGQTGEAVEETPKAENS